MTTEHPAAANPQELAVATGDHVEEQRAEPHVRLKRDPHALIVGVVHYQLGFLAKMSQHRMIESHELFWIDYRLVHIELHL